MAEAMDLREMSGEPKMHAEAGSASYFTSPGRFTSAASASFAVLALAACLTILNVAPAAAVSTEHVFDPVLSLSGDCSTSKADLTPDPGICPMPPGVAGVDHPPVPFSREVTGVAVAPGGYIYVELYGETPGGKDGHIDIFNAAGEYLTEVKNESGEESLAVSSTCDLYVAAGTPNGDSEVVRYTPSSCPLTKATTYSAPVRVAGPFDANGSAIAIDRSNNHLFVSNIFRGSRIVQHDADGTVDGLDEAQRLTVDASSGTFNLRVFSKFGRAPDSDTNVMSVGAAGSGDLTSGSATVTSVVGGAGSGSLKAGSSAVTSLVTSMGRFKAGEPVSGAGIAPGTTILEATRGPVAGFLRLSQPATATAASVPIASHGLGDFAEGQEVFAPGIPAGTTIEELKPIDDSLVLSAGATADVAGASLSAGSAGGSTGGTVRGDTTSGSPTVTSVASAEGTGTTLSGFSSIDLTNTASGAFRPYQQITGPGIPAGTTIVGVEGNALQLSQQVTASGSDIALTALDPIAKGEQISGPGIPPGTTIQALSGNTLTLSAAATASANGSSLSVAIPFDASAEAVQSAVAAIPTIGEGNVSVSGGPGGPGAANPYSISFEGALASMDFAQLGAEDTGLSGSGAASVTTSVAGYDGSFGRTIAQGFQGVAINAKAGELVAAAARPGDNPSAPEKDSIYIFDLADGHLKNRVDGVDVPGGAFRDGGFGLSVAVDEASGELFVDSAVATKRVYRMVRSGEAEYHYLADPELDQHFYAEDHSYLAVDNDPASPNRGHVFVTSTTIPGHVFAFGPPVETGPPIVAATTSSGITLTEATLAAELNPHGLPTEYRFQYVDEKTYLRDIEELGQGHGFDHAEGTAIASLPTGSRPVPVEAQLSALSPGTTYRFRVLATNHCEPKSPTSTCAAEGERKNEGKGPEVPHRFATYPDDMALPGSCQNRALRTGASIHLPDCRAYELVTPPDTNGRVPFAQVTAAATQGAFNTQFASPDGESVLFMSRGGSLPGIDGTGNTDGYEALRHAGVGWQTRSAGPSGAQIAVPSVGGASPDHGYQFWKLLRDTNGKNRDGGSLSIEGKSPTYVREPGGAFRLLGKGTLASDPEAEGRWITPGASHLIFVSRLVLEEGASESSGEPPNGNIYDRAPDGSIRVVSLLPNGGSVPPEAKIGYQGSSADGTAVAFTVVKSGNTTLYVSRSDAATVAIDSGSPTFAGLSSDGRRLTYLKGGNVFSVDTAGETTVPVGSGGESTVVNVSADGSHIYFVSPKVLGKGAGPVAGRDNLYVWDGATGGVTFVAVLSHPDVIGTGGASPSGGLGLWTEALKVEAAIVGGLAIDPSRTTPDGDVLLFESHADLGDYAAHGHTEIYRYDAADQSLSCISCNPTLAPPSSDASLQELTATAPVNSLALIQNVSEDGRFAFFQSAEALVPGDVDNTLDVYEWREQGAGGCADPPGCLALLSSGHSGSPNYLYAMTPDGHDVFFTSSDLLVGADRDSTDSIYDARIGGGFAEPAGAACSGEACRAQPTGAPSRPAAANALGSSNDGAALRCGRNQHRVRLHGRVRCAAKKHHKLRGHAGTRRSHRQGGAPR